MQQLNKSKLHLNKIFSVFIMVIKKNLISFYKIRNNFKIIYHQVNFSYLRKNWIVGFKLEFNIKVFLPKGIIKESRSILISGFYLYLK